MAKKNFGDFLVESNKVTLDQLAQAKAEQKRLGVNLSTAFVHLGAVSERDITEKVAEFSGLQMVDLDNFEIDPELIALVPKNICKRHQIIPVTKSLGTIVIACSQPPDVMVHDDLAFVTRSKVEFVITAESAIENAISKYYDSQSFGSVISDLESSEIESISSSEGIDEGADEGAEPIIRFVNLVLSEAVKIGASDIHIEPYEARFRIRFRIDGKLVERLQPPPGAAAAITNRIKILGSLDISEKRRPQDGRIKIRLATGQETEFRVSSSPSMYGEKIVLRILDQKGLNKPMVELGFEADDLAKFKEALARPIGMTLVTGPTGSGKSTTVYSALNELNTPDINICTAEDPVEMNIEGINHVQVNTAIDLTFSRILKTFLRQDPDVIFVGEIRDHETAEIAFKAASTGHMVMSTLHTNDAASTITRLTEIGVAPYLVAATVSLVVAQRLVGLVCGSCRAPADVSQAILLELGVPREEISSYSVVTGEGCGQCNGTGIRGRIAIHEVMPITTELKRAIIRNVAADELRKIAVEEGMRSLRQNALLKLRQGLTNVEQVLNSTVWE